MGGLPAGPRTVAVGGAVGAVLGSTRDINTYNTTVVHPTVIENHYYPQPYPQGWNADRANAELQRKLQQQQDQIDRAVQAQQRQMYQQNQQRQQDEIDRAQQAEQRAAYEENQRRQQDAAQQKAAEDEAERQRQIKQGEDEENRMAAEAQKKAEEEDAERQRQIKQGEQDELNQAAGKAPDQQ